MLWYTEILALRQKVLNSALSLFTALSRVNIRQLKDLLLGIHIDEVSDVSQTEIVADFVLVVFGHRELVEVHVLGPQEVSHLFELFLKMFADDSLARYSKIMALGEE